MSALPDPKPSTADPVVRDILDAALAEFAHYGFEGARIESITARTQTSKRMIYYHFGSKDKLYGAVLEHAYRMVRDDEAFARLESLPPMEALVSFAGNAFDSFNRHPDFIRLTVQENLNGARFLQGRSEIARINQGGVLLVGRIVERGQREGSMRAGLSALDVYINFVGLCVYQISARASFKALFDVDFFDPAVRERRRASICDCIARYVAA